MSLKCYLYIIFCCCKKWICKEMRTVPCSCWTEPADVTHWLSAQQAQETDPAGGEEGAEVTHTPTQARAHTRTHRQKWTGGSVNTPNTHVLWVELAGSSTKKTNNQQTGTFYSCNDAADISQIHQRHMIPDMLLIQ